MAPIPKSNSPFSKEQEIWMILDLGVIHNITTVRRNFRTKFNVPPKQVPTYMAFKRLVGRFETRGNCSRPPPRAGLPSWRFDSEMTISFTVSLALSLKTQMSHTTMHKNGKERKHKNSKKASS